MGDMCWVFTAVVSGTPSAARLVLLGDSLASGTGAARPDDALGPRLAAALAERGILTEPRVVAVPGATSADLPEQVRRAVSLRPHLALVVVGSNDLLRLLPPRPAAAVPADAVRALRAEGAQVLVVPAPDLSVVPQVALAWRAGYRLVAERLTPHLARLASATHATARGAA